MNEYIFLSFIKLVLFVECLRFVTMCDCSNILGIMPTASLSHQIPFHPLWRELSLRGHQVTVLTTDPMQDHSLTNLTEIHMRFSYDFFEKVKFYETLGDDTMNFWDQGKYLQNITIDYTYLILQSEEVRNLLKSGKKFDLVIAEAHFPAIIGLIGSFRCPWIGVSSMDPAMYVHVAAGNPNHPILNPDYNLAIEDPTTPCFLDRVFSFIYRAAYIYEFNTNLLPILTEIYEGTVEDLPPFTDILKNISMLFTGTSPIFQNLRPVYPNTIALGTGMHLSKPKPLPKGLKQFLDGADNGVIYFSLGSNVKSKTMSNEFKKAIIGAFAEIPYKVLMKIDGELEGISSNVLVQNWMPQQDILRHPNIKLFITQGGLQSLQEAVTNDIPLIGIPFFGDQITNINKVVKWGYGIKLDKKKISKEVLLSAINEVMRNPKYKEKAREMGEIFRDEEIPSLQRAVYWTEYVIRHKGARHLRSPAANMPTWKYYMLDVIVFLASIISIVIFMCLLLVKLMFGVVLGLCQKRNNSKIKFFAIVDKNHCRICITMLFKLLCVVLQILGIHSARILTIIPTAFSSHHSPFQPLWRELALRGHQLTVLTTDPQKNTSLINLKEIDMSYTYDIYRKYNFTELLSSTDSIMELGSKAAVMFDEVQHTQLSSPEVQELIHNKNIHFDLLMIEAQSPELLGFAWRFQCPTIAITTLDCAMQYHDSLGNPIHPVINPDFNLEVGHPEEMGFADRLRSFLFIPLYKYFMYHMTYPRIHNAARKFFGDDLPPLKEIQDNISMLFISTHPLFHNIRPLNPNTITIGGGMHIRQPKPLPEDLKKFLDGAENGAIYFALGGNVNCESMSNEFRKTLVDAFAQIPYKVLMKIDCQLGDISSNVLVQKWVPQQDILRHRNVKLFITHGGILSLQEAVINNIPVIGIPFFGDQKTNLNKIVKWGSGIKLDRRKLSKNVLLYAINEVINNPKYREKAREMGDIYRDEEIPSLQRAIYWTEYVIRNKGARHLRSLAVKMPAWKYYMLDVIAFLTSIVLLITFVCYLALKFFFRSISRLSISKFSEKKYN
ncbi:uncharacterized protein [Leptinotarsa decemlineata]|uniref:uncharacterized protein n=1 Tax=Leptinotarsa decemlineata TaxID=7539 RepID=UPI003D3092C8